MKTIKFLMLGLITILSVSCSKDDNNTSSDNETQYEFNQKKIVGDWIELDREFLTLHQEPISKMRVCKSEISFTNNEYFFKNTYVTEYYSQDEMSCDAIKTNNGYKINYNQITENKYLGDIFFILKELTDDKLVFLFNIKETEYVKLFDAPSNTHYVKYTFLKIN